ncbi:MAG: fluoride exporter [Thermacetogenium sp.]|jgi:CrcB protein|uniref:Fluoride-specific ion channel FluC n=1 Tax=Thermacetogenium phaeum TaxID=85874 RepID=A0A101FFT9_9THEO|nr:MAG: Protein CrcB-like protein [Thermacetogenium phaeum]MDN5365035.1 fluoride exporter [Thermacetogenium sp.]MDN5376309.1 fluoride exporter [Thermacetogenium sp.]
MDLIWVGLGGLLGALARYGVWRAFLHWSATFPWGTLITNITGSILLGLIQALALEGLILSPRSRLFLGVGFCGAYTTFSTFTKESLDLLDSSVFPEALLYVSGTTVLCLAGVWLGIVLGRLSYSLLEKRPLRLGEDRD